MTVKPFRGGRVFSDQDAAEAPPAPVRRYPCFADGCPMAGTIFSEGVTDERPGTCAFHYAVNASDIPKVTQVLQDWLPVSREINRCRLVLTAPETATDARAQDAEFALAVHRVQTFVATGGWGDAFDAKPHETYGGWSKRMEAFIGGRVVEVLSIHRRSA